MKHPLINKEKKQASFLIFLAVIGLILAVDLVVIRFTGVNSFCDFSGFTCATPIEGAISDIAGVPIALIASLAFVAILAFTVHVYSKSHIKGHAGKRRSATWLVVLLFLASLFTLYLFAEQAFYLDSFCMLCILLGADIIIAFIVSILLFREVVR